MTKRDLPCDLTAKVLAHRLRDRTVSAADVLEAHLSRIEQLNAKLNAVVSLDAERARKRAHEADRALARGELWGPLHGVPMTLKDGHEVAGLRTTVGTKELNHVAEQDGTVAARLKAAGAIIIGHSNVPPWLSDHQTEQSDFRPHEQPVGSRAHAGWLEWRRCGRTRRRNDAARDRLGPRRLDPTARALLRRLRAQADRAPRSPHRLRPAARGYAETGAHHGVHRPDGA